MRPRPDVLRYGIVLLAVIGAAVAFTMVRSARKRSAAPAVMTEPVERRDIALTIEATGTVEPIDLVEVKSKASGQIVRMPVEVGSTVQARDLLAQIDTRDVQNQYDQSNAALRAAQAKLDISRAQKKRADDLFAQQVITADEYETAVLDFANSEAQIVKMRTDLDLARQRLEDATVRAPISGTVLEQLVSTGQVIASATSSASGGTSLLKMADLSRIRLRALVSETDVGNVRSGQTATVTVDAFPQRSFIGQVEKIEPQAVVQQSVTMFPVLIAITNDDRLLMPGMNGEVTMLVEQRNDVAAVPVDAVRSMREIATVAPALGLEPDSVRAQVERQIRARIGARASGMGGGSDSGGSRSAWTAGAGSPSDSARRRGARGARSGRVGGRGSGAGAAVTGGPGTAALGGAGGAGGAGGRASRAQIVFVKTDRGLEPRLVRLGLSDFDYTEVLDGVKEGEQVALIGVAEAQAQRVQSQSRIRQRMGSGVPGVPGAGGTGAGGRTGSGGGRSGGGS